MDMLAKTQAMLERLGVRGSFLWSQSYHVAINTYFLEISLLDTTYVKHSLFVVVKVLFQRFVGRIYFLL